MKRILNICLFSTLLFFFACGKEEEVVTSDTFWKCKIEGEVFETTGTFAYAVDFLDDITIYGLESISNTTNLKTMYIKVDGDAEIGEYELNKDSETIAYYFPDSSVIDEAYLSSNDKGSGRLDITLNDGEYIEGTFDFNAENDVDGTIVKITEGEFRVKITI